MSRCPSASLVWVVGGGGMLGQAVVGALRRRRWPTVTSGRQVPLQDLGALRTFYRSLGRGGRPVIIINCAAMTAVDECERQLEAAWGANARGMQHLGQLAAAEGCGLLQVSSDYVFGAEVPRRPLAETDAATPTSAYGRSKLLGEALMWQALGEAPGSWGAVVRTSWLFGEHGGNFVATMLRLMAQRQRLEVVDDQWGRPTYTGDLAEAIVQLAGIGTVPAPAGTYHFANSGPISWHGFARTIWAMARRRALPVSCRQVVAVPTSQVPRPAPRPAWSVLSTAKVAGVLGRRPRSWRLALGDFLAAAPASLTSVS